MSRTVRERDLIRKLATVTNLAEPALPLLIREAVTLHRTRWCESCQQYPADGLPENLCAACKDTLKAPETIGGMWIG